MALKSNRNTRGSVNKGSTQNGIPSGITRTDNTNISNDVIKAISTLGDRLLGEVRKLNETLGKSNAKTKQSENKDVKALANLVKKSAPDRKSAKKESNTKALETVNKMAVESYLSETKSFFDKFKKGEMSVIEKLQAQYNGELKSLNDEALKFFGSGYKANENYQRELEILNNRYDKLKNEVSMKGITSYVKENKTETQKLIDKYHNELKTLKESGLATYGKGYEGSEAYQKELKALEQHYGQAIVDSKKKNNILLKGLDSVKGAVTNLPKDTQKSLKASFLGPLNLLLSPIQDFFGGGVGKLLGKVVGGAKFLFRKFTNKKPTASQVLKEGGQSGLGAVYLGNILKSTSDEDKKESLLDKLKGFGEAFKKFVQFIPSLIGSLIGFATKITKIVPAIKAFFTKGAGAGFKAIAKKFAGPAMIAIALIEMAIDGIKGLFKSKEWGTSKLSGFLGGFLAGTGEGIKGAFKNMGKWATLGAGIGFMLPPGNIPGAIIGGILGAVIGGILGFIGGEKLAKGFDKIGTWFKEKVWGGIKTFFGNIWQNITYVFGAIKEAFLTVLNLDGLKKIGEAWKSDGSFAKKLGKSLGAFFMWVVGLPLRLLKAEHKILDKLIVQPFKQLFAKIKEVFSIQNILKVLTNIKDKIAEIGTAIWEGLTNIFSIENIKSVFNKGVKMVSIVGNFVKDFFGGFGESIKEALGEIKLVKWLKEKLIDPIFGVFEKIANIFGAIKTMGVKGLTSAFASGDFFGSISDRADALGRVKELNKQKQEGFLSDTEMQEYTNLMKEWKFKEKDVNDAIIKADGTVIHTSPDDNIIATKNLPANVDTIRMQNANEMSRSLETDLGMTDNDGVTSRLDKIVSLMGQFINKEPVKYTMPAQTRADLDLLIMGGAL